MKIPASAVQAWSGRWSISRDAYIYLAPTSIISVVLMESHQFTFNEIGGWFTASATGYLLFCALLFLAHRTVFAQRSYVRTSIWLIFIVGGTAGMLKGATTAYVSYLLSLEDNLQVAIQQRIFVAGILGLAGVPAVALVSYSLDKFRHERAKLIAEQMRMNSQELQTRDTLTAMTRELRHRIERTLTTSTESLTHRMQESAQPWQEIADELRDAAQTTVRNLSHSLWQTERMSIPDISILDLAKTTVTTSAFPIHILIPILTVTSIPATFDYYPADVATKKLVLNALSISLIYSLATQLIKKFHRFANPIYALSILLACVLPVYFGFAIFDDPLDERFLGTSIVFDIWLIMLTLTCGLIDTAIKQEQQTLQRLKNQVAESRIRSVAENNELIRISNDMAKYLHGNLQSRLMASAFAIETAGQSNNVSNLENELAKARESIQTPFDQFDLSEFSNLPEETNKLKLSWQGVINLDVSIEGNPNLVPTGVSRNLLAALEEAMSNALRHGAATDVIARINIISDEISMRVVDNGIGPRNVVSGMGSSLFDSVAGSSWSLNRGSDGIGAELVLHVSL